MTYINFPKACFFCATTENLNLHPFQIGYTVSERASRHITEYSTQLYNLIGYICTDCKTKRRMKGIDYIVFGLLILITIPATIIYGFSQNKDFWIFLFFLSLVYLFVLFFGINLLIRGINLMSKERPYLIKTVLTENPVRFSEHYWVIKYIWVPNNKYANLLQQLNPNIKIHVNTSNNIAIFYSIFKFFKNIFKPKKKENI